MKSLNNPKYDIRENPWTERYDVYLGNTVVAKGFLTISNAEEFIKGDLAP